MDLYLTGTSPYARKLRVQIAARGMEDRVHQIVTNPLDDPPELLRHSATGKVPVLVDGGLAIIDSRVIAEYLDAKAGPPSMLPQGEAMWIDRVRTAIADSVVDAAVSVVMESRRPATEQSASFVARQRERILRTAGELVAGQGGRALTLGDIATATALSYLGFRLPDLDWRAQADPALAAWHLDIESTPPFRAAPFG